MEKINTIEADKEVLHTLFSAEALAIFFKNNQQLEYTRNFSLIFSREKPDVTLKYNLKSTLKKSIYNEVEWIEAIFFFYNYLKETNTDSNFLKSIAFIYSCEDFYYNEKNSMKLSDLVNLMLKNYGFY